jgi:NAD(P)-dependent dehydrogenase (short-subunit alcohol dehydrogenase family)
LQHAERREILQAIARSVFYLRAFDCSGRTIDWLIFNAGVAEVTALDWTTVAVQLVQEPILMFTLPRYLIEKVGSTTDDGIGLIFQANAFGHYYIVSHLRPINVVETFRTIVTGSE